MLAMAGSTTKRSIATGAIGGGEQFPGVRKLAEDLLINPNTALRA